MPSNISDLDGGSVNTLQSRRGDARTDPADAERAARSLVSIRPGAVLLVVGKGEDAFDVSWTATETIGELSWRGALGAPAQQSALERSEPWLPFGGPAAGEAGQSEHTFDEVAAAIEASPDLARDDARRCEPTYPTFERAEVFESIHELVRYRLRAKRDSAGRNRPRDR